MSKKYSSLPKPVSAFDAALCSNVCKSFSAFYIYICVCCVAMCANHSVLSIFIFVCVLCWSGVCVCVCVYPIVLLAAVLGRSDAYESSCVCAWCVAWSLMFAHQIQL